MKQSPFSTNAQSATPSIITVSPLASSSGISGTYNTFRMLFEDNENILRPANYPGNVPGDGVLLTDIGGMTALIINLLGVIMMEPLENPFYTAQKILKRYEGKYDISILDFHAEATAEKKALAYYLKDKVNVLFGTHTHVQTADEMISEKGTAYITDIGMTGPSNSVIGIGFEK